MIQLLDHDRRTAHDRTAHTRPPIERMRLIATLLRQGRHFTGDEICAACECERKTVLRDLAFLRDRLGYDFFFDKSANTYRMICAPAPVL